MRYIEGKITLITGASSGIGAAVARVFAEAGCPVVLAARRKDRLDQLAAEIAAAGGEALAIQCDVTDEAAVEHLFAKTLERFARLDILINNAGIADHTPTTELSLARWQEVVDVNLTAAFLCAREAMRIMKRQQGGRMLHIGSLSAQVPRPNTAAYAATKFALAGLNHSLAIDGRADGIASSIYHPGIVGTELVRVEGQRDPHASIGGETTARAILAMCDVPDHVNFLEGTMLPIGMPFLGRG
ncbi:MAG TPA: SDR family oxidoreductase [Sphingomonadaceae bacterium]|nr:SDR family oxidoreductase [Sphingomonadaceae bacterium]